MARARQTRLSVCARSLEDETLADHQGPWSHPPPTPPPRAARTPRPRLSRGVFIWLAIVGLGVALYVGLQFAFPGQLSSMDQAGALQLLGWLALVSSGVVFARRMRVSEIVRNIALWVAIVGVAVLGYSYRDAATGAFQRIRGELIPAMAVPASAHAMTVTAADDGGFYVIGQVNGKPVRFAIDTGANSVLLSPADAQRVGIDPDGLKFASPSETANGVGYTAAVTLDRLDVGQIHLAAVPAGVNRAPMSTSLLGMAFLKRLDSFEVKGDRMKLRWRG